MLPEDLGELRSMKHKWGVTKTRFYDVIHHCIFYYGFNCPFLIWSCRRKIKYNWNYFLWIYNVHIALWKSHILNPNTLKRSLFGDYTTLVAPYSCLKYERQTLELFERFSFSSYMFSDKDLSSQYFRYELQNSIKKHVSKKWLDLREFTHRYHSHLLISGQKPVINGTTIHIGEVYLCLLYLQVSQWLLAFW